MPPRLGIAVRLAVCLVLGLAGAAVGVAAAGPTDGRTGPGTATADLRPALGRGLVDAYVPLVDWGIRSRRVSGAGRPRPRGAEGWTGVRRRRPAVGGERRASAAPGPSADTREIVQARSVVVGRLGARGRDGRRALRRRSAWLRSADAAGWAAAPQTGLAAAALAAAATATMLRSVDDDAFREPVFYARGASCRICSPSPSRSRRRLSATATRTSRPSPGSRR